MRLWRDNFHGRLTLKTTFVEVRSDPFQQENIEENLFVVRMEVYPQTEEDKFFLLKLKKKRATVKEETC